jgi:hypothetical protein
VGINFPFLAFDALELRTDGQLQALAFAGIKRDVIGRDLRDLQPADRIACFHAFTILRTGAFEKGKITFIISDRSEQREGLGALWAFRRRF